MRKILFVSLLAIALYACHKDDEKTADLVADSVVADTVDLADGVTAVDAADAVSAADAPSAATP